MSLDDRGSVDHQSSVESDTYVNTTSQHTKQSRSSFTRFEHEFNNKNPRVDVKSMSEEELRQNTEKLKL